LYAPLRHANLALEQNDSSYLAVATIQAGAPTKLEDADDYEIFRPDRRPYEMEEWPLMRSIRFGGGQRREFVYPLAGGTELLVRCDSSPVYDDEGHIIARILIAHDITEQKRAEEQLVYHAHLLENINSHSDH
jgi:hypothetical protein